MKSLPAVILGASSFGDSVSYDVAADIVNLFIYDVKPVNSKRKMIDTSFLYSNGNSEQYLGKILDTITKNSKKDAKQGQHTISIASKANPRSAGGLSKAGIKFQFETSCKRLKLENDAKYHKMDVYYFHWPDKKTNIVESLETINELYKQGKFERFGLSNYSSWQVAEIYYLCKKNGFVLPTVYQGMYNPLTREIESELLPCLRHFGIVFYAYNPLAGGMLTGKHDFINFDHCAREDDDHDDDEKNADSQDKVNSIKKGRFHGNTNVAKIYRQRYWKKCYFEAIKLIEKVLVDEYNDKVSIIEATLRWMQHHSKLNENDGVILGGSKMVHFVQNTQALLCKQGLNDNVVNAFDDAWQLCKGQCPAYFR